MCIYIITKCIRPQLLIESSAYNVIRVGGTHPKHNPQSVTIIFFSNWDLTRTHIQREDRNGDCLPITMLHLINRKTIIHCSLNSTYKLYYKGKGRKNFQINYVKKALLIVNDK